MRVRVSRFQVALAKSTWPAPPRRFMKVAFLGVFVTLMCAATAHRAAAEAGSRGLPWRVTIPATMRVQHRVNVVVRFQTAAARGAAVLFERRGRSWVAVASRITLQKRAVLLSFSAPAMPGRITLRVAIRSRGRTVWWSRALRVLVLDAGRRSSAIVTTPARSRPASGTLAPPGATPSSVTTSTPSSGVPLKTVPDTQVAAGPSNGSSAQFAQSLPLTSTSGAVVNDPNCSANTLPANDDGSTGELALPFRLNFYGTSYTNLWVNNNGDVTFTAPLGTFTPFLFTGSTPPIIAPFFADVDTRGAGSGLVTYGATSYQGHPAFCVDWPNVGYYGAHTDKLNDFQLLLVSRSDRSPGDFDIIFNYNQIQWETGDASGGSGGFGGASAGVGFAAGDGNPSHFFSLPGTLQPGSFLDTNSATGLIHNSRGTTVRGRYIFPIANGTLVGGSTPQEIRNQASVRCLDANLGTIAANGTKVQLWDCTGGVNQEWSLGSDGTIRNTASGRCLGVAPSVNGTAGTSLQLWNCDGSPSQHWTTSGSGAIQNPATGLNLDGDNGTINANGTKIQLWPANGGANQSWYVAPAGSRPQSSASTYCAPQTGPAGDPNTGLRFVTSVNFKPCMTVTDVYDGTSAASRSIQPPADSTQPGGCPSYVYNWGSALACQVVSTGSHTTGTGAVDVVTMSLDWNNTVVISYFYGSCVQTLEENDTMTLTVRTSANGTRSGSSTVKFVDTPPTLFGC